MKTCSDIKLPLHPIECIEFNWNKKKPSFIKGKIYSFINEFGNDEKGQCISYNEKTGKVKLKKIKC